MPVTIVEIFENDLAFHCFHQLEKQKQKEELEKKMLEQRAVFVEKAKKINLEPEPDERHRKSGGKVGDCFFFTLPTSSPCHSGRACVSGDTES